MILLNIPKIKLCLLLLGLVPSLMAQGLVGITKIMILMIVPVVVLGFLVIGSIELAVFKTLFEFHNKNIHLDSPINP